MTVTTTPAELVKQSWEKRFYREYVRDSGFQSFMGKAPTSVIQVKREDKVGGDSITLGLVSRLTGNGVSGNGTLVGSEEALGQYSHKITVDYRRNAVALTAREQQFSAPDQLEVVGPLLKEWCMNEMRNDICDALLMAANQKTLVAPYNTNYNATASGAEQDAWVLANADRVLFGDAVGNLVSGDFDASIVTVAASHTLTAARVSLMKRIAKTSDPHIRPIRVKDKGREYYVLFTDSRAFRDLKEDLKTTNLDGRERDVNSNPVFQDGELIYDGVIVCEIPELKVFAAAGASGIDVSPALLCGAQAIGVAWGQMPKATKRKEDDYGFITGRGIQECIGVSKIQRLLSGQPLKDHGMVTGFFAGVEDA